MTNMKVPIVAFANHPWDEPQWMNRQHILSRLAQRGWDVYYCTGVLDIWQRRNKCWEDSGFFHNAAKKDGVTIINSGKFPFLWNKSRSFTKLAIQNYCRFIFKTAKITKDSKFLLLNFSSDHTAYIEELKPTILHMHVYDLFWKMEKWNRSKNEKFLNILDLSALITASSPMMVKEIEELSNKKAILLPNGVDLELFEPKQKPICPDDLLVIPHPRIANIGTLNGKIDISRLAELAKASPNYNFVMVGRVEKQEFSRDEKSKKSFDEFEKLKNVHFIGEKDRKEIPSYAYNVDILLICYKTDDGNWAKGGYPLKLHESLITGVPVISSSIDVIKSQFSDVVYLADSTDEWSDKISTALKGEASTLIENRKVTAKNNTWDKRIDKLEALYSNILNGI